MKVTFLKSYLFTNITINLYEFFFLIWIFFSIFIWVPYFEKISNAVEFFKL